MRIVTIEGRGPNALGTATLERLISDLDAAGGSPVLLRGAGKAFSAGLDLREVASLDGARMATFLRLLERAMSAIYLYPGPTAAAVNGHAIAGGCVLALACDVRIGIDAAQVKFGLNEVALGLRFPPRVLAIVRSRIPRERETEVLLGAALYSPHEALRMGMLDEVSADPVARAQERLEAIASHPAGAYAQAKGDIRGRVEADLASDAALDAWLEESVGGWTSPDLHARIAGLLR
jgi:enoyl-CoA hydratase/carnithine racemase